MRFSLTTLVPRNVEAKAVALFLLLCAALTPLTFHLRDSWVGVPPAPHKAEALLYGFGDTQLAYRTISLMLQNAGDVGGRVTNLRNYNYARLGEWFDLTYALDWQANMAPSLAAYYYGGTPKGEDTRYLITYLAKAGRDKIAGQERWRWLAQAVYLARFRVKDVDLALQMAQELADLAQNNPDMPAWTKQMPAFVMSKVGQKKAARDLLLTIAATDKTLQPADINQTCWYIDHNLRELGDGLETNTIYQFLCRPLGQVAY